MLYIVYILEHILYTVYDIRYAMLHIIYTTNTIYILSIVYTINYIVYIVFYIHHLNTIYILYIWYTIYSILYILYTRYYIYIYITYTLPITYTEIRWRPQYILDRTDYNSVPWESWKFRETRRLSSVRLTYLVQNVAVISRLSRSFLAVISRFAENCVAVKCKGKDDPIHNFSTAPGSW